MEAQNLVESENNSVEKENVVTLIILTNKKYHLKCDLEYAEGKFLSIDEDIYPSQRIKKIITDKNYNTELFINSLSKLTEENDCIKTGYILDRELALQDIYVMAKPEVHFINMYFPL